MQSRLTRNKSQEDLYQQHIHIVKYIFYHYEEAIITLHQTIAVFKLDIKYTYLQKNM